MFDPACGSGNFLVIAYIKLREIEAEIMRLRGEVTDSGYVTEKSWLKLENFYGIELKDFAAEVARLSLLIAEFQCDVRFIGQKEATALVLPLRKTGQIVCGNALRTDWLEVCPPVSGESAEIVETYICGNPPYLGSTWQSKAQKADLQEIFTGLTTSWKSLDYVSGWFMKAASYGKATQAASAFVSTNSICQGQQVPILWPVIFNTGAEIHFAYTSFKWANLAAHNAGVTVIIVGLSQQKVTNRKLYSLNESHEEVVQLASNINPYLASGKNVIVQKKSVPLSSVASMSFGNKPVDGGHLLLSETDLRNLQLNPDQHKKFIRRIYGSAEFIRGINRYCLWISDDNLEEALSIETISQRTEGVRQMRLASRDKGANDMAEYPHQMREMNIGKCNTIALPCVSSENREYFPVGVLDKNSTVTNLAFALYDAPLWNMALIASKLHLVWIATVCGKLKTDFRYSNTLGWNTFPVPTLTEKNKADLTRCAEGILLAREAHYPKTIADLYNPENMPENLREAHERNDEVLERIYIGRRFKNDTERLEKLFDLYTKMTAQSKGATS